MFDYGGISGFQGCQKYVFSRCVWQWEHTNTVFSRVLGLWGTPFPLKLRSGCDFGRLGDPGGQGMPIIGMLSYFLAMGMQICGILSSFKGQTQTNTPFDGTPFLTDFGINFGLKID